MHIRTFVIIFFTFLFSVSFQLLAQPGNGQGGYGNGSGMTGSVKGVVVSSATSKPLEYAYLVLHKVVDSSLVTGGITDVTGAFKIEKVPFGKYYLAITLIGHKPQKISNVFLGPKNPDKVLDTIRLDPSTAVLNAVEIKDKKVDVEYTLDKKIVNVEKSLVSTGGSAVDVMKTIPSITVDIDGNVSLKGSTNITVLVDGKPSGLTGSSRSAILDQIPASSIESIELISNPSAKYDPDGMSGIINIVLKKKKDRGYHGIFTVNAGTGDRYNGSVNLNWAKNKVNVFASLDGRINHGKGWGDMNRVTTDSLGRDSTVISHSQSWRKSNSGNIKLGMDYYMNAKNSFTVSGLLGLSDDDHSDISKVRSLNDAENLVSYYESPSTENNSEQSFDGNLYYKRSFTKKGENLTFDGAYSTSNETEKGTQDYYFYQSDMVTPIYLLTEMQKTTTVDHNTITTLQLDYSNPFSKKSKLEAGAKSIIRSIDNDYQFLDSSIYSTVWVDTIPLSNRFLYDEQIHAAYATYSNAFGIFEFQAGLRGEMALTKSTQKTTNQEFKKNYYSLFPSLHMNLNLKNDNSLQLSYSRRVNRPGYWSLNPFVEIPMKGVKRYGNPYLTPEYIDSYELGHMKYWKKTSLNSSIFYKRINDAIQRFIFFDSAGVQNATQKNIASGTSYGLEFIVSQEITDWWKANATFSYFKTEMRGTQDENNLTNSNYSWTAKLNTTATVWKNMDLQLTGNYRAPMVNIQGSMAAMYSADIALKKELFKNASLSVRLSDIFRTQKFKMESSGNNTQTGSSYVLNNERRRDSRVLFVGFTYKINGGVKSKTKNRTYDTNEDIEGNDF